MHPQSLQLLLKIATQGFLRLHAHGDKLECQKHIM
jgi:hypothetical protein